MNYKDILKQKIKKYDKEDIVITKHAKEQAAVRQISLEEIRQNIIKPERLYFVELQQAKQANEEKYNCYFEYSDITCHRYILVVNANCVVCTVIKINRKWKEWVKKYDIQIQLR